MCYEGSVSSRRHEHGDIESGAHICHLGKCLGAHALGSYSVQIVNVHRLRVDQKRPPNDDVLRCTRTRSASWR
jgi:hypothetical protein